ncbi:MAG: hypothetical protein Q8P67_09725 [archaeon]|nr:hypothetical protein [archaeon]
MAATTSESSSTLAEVGQDAAQDIYSTSNDHYTQTTSVSPWPRPVADLGFLEHVYSAFYYHGVPPQIDPPPPFSSAKRAHPSEPFSSRGRGHHYQQQQHHQQQYHPHYEGSKIQRRH